MNCSHVSLTLISRRTVFHLWMFACDSNSQSSLENYWGNSKYNKNNFYFKGYSSDNNSYKKNLFIGDIIVNCSITSYTEVYGSQVTLRCSVTYQTKNEPVHLFWTSSSTSISLEGNDDHVTLTNYSVAIPDKDGFKMKHYFLTLTSLSFKNNGVYSCYFRDQVSWGFCQTLKLKVIGGK